MNEPNTTLEVSTNATLAVGLAMLAVAAVGGGALVTSLDGAQVGHYLSDGSPGWSAGSAGIGGGLFGTGVLATLAVTGASGSTLAVGLSVGGPLGAAVGAGIGAL